MIILEFLGRIFIEIIFEGIILEFFRFIGRLFGRNRNTQNSRTKRKYEIQRLEKKYLYKGIVLTQNLNAKLKYGVKGAVLEIINEDSVFAEFYDRSGKPIEIENELVFQVGINQFQLKP